MFTCPDCKFESEWWDSLLEHYYWAHGAKYPGKKKVDKKQDKNSKDK